MCQAVPEAQSSSATMAGICRLVESKEDRALWTALQLGGGMQLARVKAWYTLYY